MQKIADEAGVSRITVWKVLNNHPGVSPALHSQILETAIRLGYPCSENLLTVPPTAATVQNTEATATISVVVSRPDSSAFWLDIIHQIAKEAGNQNYSLLYTYIPYEMLDNYTLPQQLTDGNLQGMIVLNVYDPILFAQLNELPVPKVFLDSESNFPIKNIQGDMLLLEGRDTVAEITDSLIRDGKKNIGFIGDIHYALTNRMRYEGYLTSMRRHHFPIPEKYCFTEKLHTYPDEIHAYLSSLSELPEAFVCVNDFVANCVYQYFQEHEIPVPETVLLTGYDNVAEYSELSEWLTTVDINTSQLGKRLFHQLNYRIQNPDGNKEFIFIKPLIIFR